MSAQDSPSLPADPQSIPPGVISMLCCGIDSFIQAGAHLPFGPCEALSKTLSAYNDAKASTLQRKLSLFIRETESISNYIREERIEWLEKQEEEKLGRQIALMLERADDERKAKIYGQLYCSLIRQDLTREQFSRLCANVDRSFYEDLRRMGEFEEATLATDEIKPVAESLHNAGLLSLEGMNMGGFDQDEEVPSGNYYQMNRFGRLLIEHADLCG